MGEKKVTMMLLKVDLQRCKCYKKVKKVLCKFPHVRDQVFDEKANTVTIKVVCCSPEKIRDKIRCKGGTCIKCIEIVPDPKPKPREDPPKKPPVQPIVLLGLALGYSLTCRTECYQGCGCGPCNQMCCGRTVYDSSDGCGGYKPCYPARSCGECFSDENPLACSIM